MNILHVADTHLGYSAYRKATEDGINQREMDVYNAFEQFVDYVIKTKPDLIIHAGDLFDSVRPNNRAITFSVKQLIRISKEGIPLVIIAGNHEHPKLKETGHIFSIFDHIENVYPIYNAKYETLSFDMNEEKIAVHVIPQCNSKKEFNKELKKLKPKSDADYNIFVAHGSITRIKVFSMNEFNELVIPAKILSKDFDYVALGHYHTFTKLSDNAFYSGSTESLTFAEAGNKKGFIELYLSDGKLKHNFIQLINRPMVDPKPIRCPELKLDEIMKKIKETVRGMEPKEKIFRITLDDIPAHIYRGLDFGEIRKLSSEAVHYEIKANIIKERGSKLTTTSKIDALVNEFKLFLENQGAKEKETLLELGIGYIEKIEAREEGK
ncbi:DNA repair exonuclease [Thermoplasmatales archaeon SCGC AB-539-N05]|nr:DNA repair exonuclease [Thermoplasmatales archaeon SCGC AB-539-N05]